MSPLLPYNHKNIPTEWNNSEASDPAAILYSTKTQFIPNLRLQRVLRPIMHIIHRAVQAQLPTHHLQRLEETR